MNTDAEKLDYVAVKDFSALLRGMTLKYNDDYYCINCLHLFRTINKLKPHENVCKNYYYCYIEMPEKDNNTLKQSHGEKSVKVPFTIYANTES